MPGFRLRVGGVLEGTILQDGLDESRSQAGAVPARTHLWASMWGHLR